MVTACQDKTPTPERSRAPKLDTASLTRIMPQHQQDRKAWARDMLSIMDTLAIPRTAVNACSIIAVIDQESNFVADPAVPDLGNTARKELLERVEAKMGKMGRQKMEEMLRKHPDPTDSFDSRIRALKTEHQLDQLYREMYQYFKSNYRLGLATGVASLVTGQALEEYLNPVKTLGSMQVHIDYARTHARQIVPVNTLRESLYTRYDGMYYGIHRLMLYPTQYGDPIYRFADYNSGIYSSRNAALQKQVAMLLGEKLAADGDLLSYDRDERPLTQATQSETAIFRLLGNGAHALTATQIRSDLQKEKTAAFEQTDTYRLIKEKYYKKYQKPAAYAVMPEVRITGPKINRDLNSNWYATRVERRYNTCLAQARRLGLSTRH